MKPESFSPIPPYYPTEPKNDVAGTEKVLKKLADKYKINVIVIGNGTGFQRNRGSGGGLY